LTIKRLPVAKQSLTRGTKKPALGGLYDRKMPEHILIKLKDQD